MESPQLEESVNRLTEEDLGYDELVEIYRSLSTHSPDHADALISQRALIQLLGEIIDYLYMVRSDLEKSVGLMEDDECERIVSSFTKPEADTIVDRVAELIVQWEEIETVDPNELFDEALEHAY